MLRASRGQRTPASRAGSAKLFGIAHHSASLVRVRKSSASTPRAQRVVGASRPACRPRPRGRPRRRAARRQPRVPTRRTPRRCRPGRPPSGRRTPRPGRRRRRRAGDVDADPACGQQVGGEPGPRGVGGDGAQRREEDWASDGSSRSASYAAPVARRTGLRRPGTGSSRRRELGEAGDRAASGGDVGLAPGPHVGDPARRRRRRPRSRSAPSSDQASQGEVVGEPLDGVRSAGRVGHGSDVRLGHEQGTGVAGDPAGQLGDLAGRLVEREHGHHVGTADAGAEGSNRGAQQVHDGRRRHWSSGGW